MVSSDSDLIDAVKKDVAIWNINSFAEFYMQIFGKYTKDYQNACEKFIIERRRFKRLLDQIPFIHVIPSQANYFLTEITSRFTSKQLTQKLLNEYNILIKDCDNKDGLKGKNYIRIAIRTKEDNNRLVAALKNI